MTHSGKMSIAKCLSHVEEALSNYDLYESCYQGLLSIPFVSLLKQNNELLLLQVADLNKVIVELNEKLQNDNNVSYTMIEEPLSLHKKLESYDNDDIREWYKGSDDDTVLCETEEEEVKVVEVEEEVEEVEVEEVEVEEVEVKEVEVEEVEEVEEEEVEEEVEAVEEVEEEVVEEVDVEEVETIEEETEEEAVEETEEEVVEETEEEVVEETEEEQTEEVETEEEETEEEEIEKEGVEEIEEEGVEETIMVDVEEEECVEAIALGGVNYYSSNILNGEIYKYIDDENVGDMIGRY